MCKATRFQDHSRETFEMIITAAEKLAVNDFEPANSTGDKIGCHWKDGKVIGAGALSGAFQKVLRRRMDEYAGKR